MKRARLNQSGFLPLLVVVLVVVLTGIYLVYTRVLHAQL
jgi:hypothetical protein